MLRHERITAHLWRIFDPLGVALYLCEGTDQAALIDTGFGTKGMRTFVEALTDKPLTVILTHGHFDHAPGAFEFDEAFLNERDLPILEAHGDIAYRMHLMETTHAQAGVTKEDLVEDHGTHFLPLNEDTVFDLGGVTVETHAMPGHTPGSMVALIPEDRVVIFGDAIGPGTLLIEDFSASVSEYLAAMRAFKARHEGRYDRVLRYHGTCESTPAVLDDAIEVAERILSGLDDRIPLDTKLADLFPHGNPEGIPLFSGCALKGTVRADGREGNINYRQDKAH